MPKIFRTRDIEKMKPSDVSQEFIDYFNRLSDTRKEEFAENRPDLYSAVLAWRKPDEAEPEEEIIENNPSETLVAEERKTEQPTAIVEDDREWQAIQKNVYNNIDISRAIENGLQPIEALTIADPKKCPVHRSFLKKYTPKFYKRSGAVMGVNFYLCKDCNRLFITRSEFENNDKNLNEWGVSHTFYGYDISRRYLKTLMEPYVLDPQEKIYWVDPWIEDNPVCPVHECTLEEIPCIVKYQKKAESFDAYYCEECRKVVLRKTKAILLEDQLAQVGIPSDRFVRLIRKEPVKTPVSKRKVKPDFYLDGGKKSQYTFDQIDNCYYLTEEDTVVVSYDIYCPLDGHDTQTVLGLIWVKEKSSGRRRSYMVMLGYCAECNKFYMNQSDYQTIYKTGRPEVKVIVNLDDNSYMISSGEVFNIERDNLASLESRIDHEIKDIHANPDYVSQYETVSYYDEGELYFKKERSRRRYEPRLKELGSYIPRPYQYYAEISADGKKERYYIGASEIILDRKQEVIAVGSRLGRALVNYRTINVNKDGKEYRISLSRQFDINNAALYGYMNLRTDEDVVFRQGITDPFLVRVLNIRRRQHELIDIFVTIQENQNAIVDADFHNNLVVQGCAGSGKTMVLLHRLSSLKYNESDFDFANAALILTPNDNFTLHINGLAESMQIGSINRISIERYYANILGLYSEQLKPTGPITSEMNVPQDFVDYIYSDLFRNGFHDNYRKVITEQNKLIPLVSKAAGLMNLDFSEIDDSNDSSVIPQLQKALNGLMARITVNENEIAKAADELKKTQNKKKRLAGSIKKSTVQASEALKQASQRARMSALGFLAENQHLIDEGKNRLSELESERERLIERSEFINNADRSFDEFIAENQDLIDDSITQIITMIGEQRTELASKEEETKRITELLSIPYEEMITLSSVDDTEISALLAELISVRNTLKQLQREKERVENGWIFGRARRLAGIVDNITQTEKTIETYEAEIFELLTNRRIELETTSELIIEMRSDIHNATEEAKRLLVENSKIRLDSLSDQISRLSHLVEENSSELNGYVETVYQLNDDMQDNEILAWFNRVSLFLPAVRDELQEYEENRANAEQYRTEYLKIDTDIEDAQKYYDSTLTNRYADEIRNTISELNEKVSQYTVINTYQMIFDMTSNPFMESHNIKTISGRNHRYDLYARLIFAMEYFGKAFGQIKFICIDEGQDLALNEYRLLRELKGNDVIFNIFGDTNQLIKPNRGITDWEKLKDLLSFEQYVLNENYRNTNQITRFCNDSFNMSMMQTGVDGPKVREITKGEFEQELTNLHIGENRVAVLLPRSVQKKTYINQNYLSDDVKEAIGEEIGKEKIAVMYVDEVKGIEFDKVYVVSNNMSRNEKYIAYTRALNELILVIDDRMLG